MSLSEQLHIRPAKAADAYALATLAQRTFRDSFLKDNAAADMEAYLQSSLSIDQILSELADETNSFLLAFASGADQPIGYAKLRAGPAESCVTGSTPIELERIYVDQLAIGNGVGSAIMHASIDAAQSAGYQIIWLGVWEKNHRAISFYKRWGFKTVGDHVFRLGTDNQIDLIMERSTSTQ